MNIRKLRRKKFYNIGPGVNFIKKYFPVADDEAK